jgi:hypothetical protein
MLEIFWAMSKMVLVTIQIFLGNNKFSSVIRSMVEVEPLLIESF